MPPYKQVTNVNIQFIFIFNQKNYLCGANSTHTMKTFETVLKRFQEIDIPEQFDIIVAIANGGIIPAGILNQRLQIDFQILKINLRDAQQQPKYDEPVLIEPPAFDCRGKRILLVDDRIKTG